ncbi:RHS repeat-associated core domain-containing protein [Paraflavitalea speifideaquila]|uniref:RHS repeat-associated core domain-containing protein n=1 Tax=Paraflavitalea speifideaquila TaxID=3076558 RepID=UPI0028E510CC|nr:RHS repeat-associated core domain-containing protein [Paraflavitalea speifideiaquila]
MYTYKEQVGYDANGNIQNYDRYGINPGPSKMDELGYQYYPGTNRLKRVTDQVADNAYGNSWDVILDIDNQVDSNYIYDSIGNLVADKAEKITSIKWNVYGKITEINRNVTQYDQVTTTRTRYTYDAQGNRISKVWKDYNKDSSRWELKYSWYVRDAQGNLLSTYTTVNTDTAGGNLDSLYLTQADVQLYGSSRLGSLFPQNSVVDNAQTNSGPWINPDYRGTTFYRGNRQYELSNHLGNVLTTISDRKIGVYSNGSLTLPGGFTIPVVNYYEPEMLAANDYYPFGMLSRTVGSSAKYKFGFNGKENDNEVKGYGGQVDFGSRVYDPRLGRFFSVDPRSGDSPEFSPFSFGANSPIYLVDFLGEYPEPFLRTWFKNYAQTQLGLSTNKKVGDFYEKLVVTSLHKGDKLVVHNTFLNFPSDYKRTVNAGVKPIDVRPDAIAGKLGVATQKRSTTNYP